MHRAQRGPDSSQVGLHPWPEAYLVSLPDHLMPRLWGQQAPISPLYSTLATSTINCCRRKLGSPGFSGQGLHNDLFCLLITPTGSARCFIVTHYLLLILCWFICIPFSFHFSHFDTVTFNSVNTGEGAVVELFVEGSCWFWGEGQSSET